MALYDYQCPTCKEVKEKRHGMNESPDYICCGQKMKRLISKPIGIHGANTGNRKGT